MIDKTISHYKILEKLGEGGMGVVYKAEDTKLDRFVALKFLPSHLIDDEKALNRLLKEAKSASKINHPNVCTIYTIEEYEDTHFIVMEYVDGETLRKKDKPFSIDDSLDYSVQICNALKSAHDKEVIHQDIKSENIMINNDNIVKVMDFGLAKLKEDIRSTKTGIAGTIAYMSPEQIQGLEIDNKSDIWSFGVVMYEMLTGKLPFRGEYDSAMMYSILNTEPEPFISYRTDVPTNLEHVVNRTLEKDSSKRYQNMPELLQEIRNIPTSISVSDEMEKSIVVLPFVNISPDPEQEYFSDGLTEEIITDLSQIHTMRVISRTSAMMLKGTKKSISKISQELKVQYVLEGSVRKAGNNLRITSQLIDATTDTHLWAEKYSGTLDDVFDIQEKVSRSIVEALKLKLTPKEDKQIAERPIDNVFAYEIYLKAKQEIWRMTEKSLDRAFQLLQNGLEIIGKNALLYAGIGYVYYQYVNMGFKQENYITKAEDYIKSVFELEPESSQGHFLIGLINQAFRGNQKQSIHHFKLALVANPNDSEVLLWLMLGYTLVGKTSAAGLLVERILKINPLNPVNHCFIAVLHCCEGEFDLSLEQINKVCQLEPDNTVFQFFYALILAYNQRFDETFSIIEKMEKTAPEHTWTQWSLFLKYALKREKNKISKLFTRELQNTAERDPQISSFVASFYSLLGQKEEALNWLENAVSRGFINYPFLNEHDPFLENIRGEERFKKLMERVKYEWENFEG